MDMKRDTRGFYTLEAVILIPLFILAVLSLGYFMRIEGMWENCIHGALDESSQIAAKASNGVAPATTAFKVEERVRKDNPDLDDVSVSAMRVMYSDMSGDNLISYRLDATEKPELPLFSERKFELEFPVKFRGFVGKKEKGTPMGASGLESAETGHTVWIFPQSGEKYHGESCTYVKATVHPVLLSGSVKRRYDPCGMCLSDDITEGSLVFCFGSDGTAYHRGTCRTINRKSVAIDRSEAVERGYAPCSKCRGS